MSDNVIMNKIGDKVDSALILSAVREERIDHIEKRVVTLEVNSRTTAQILENVIKLKNK